MAQQTLAKKRAVFWRAAATVLLIVAASAVAVTHWHIVSAGLSVARRAKLGWLVAALFAMATTFCLAAALYGVLALHRLRYVQTLAVELATAFVNRLLPAGLGGLGLNGVYLYKHKHTVAEATAIVSINNLIGMVAHIGLLVAVAIFYPEVFGQFASGLDIEIGPWMAMSLLAVIGCLAVLPAVRRPIIRFITNVGRSARRLRLVAMFAALLAAMLLTATYTSILYFVSQSLGVDIGLFKIFIIFSTGILAGTATPTPGGLIGAEAGLFAGFVAYGASDARAAAAVLLYRLVTYWLPLLPGLGALLVARRRRLV